MPTNPVVQAEIETLYRKYSGKMLSVLLYYTGFGGTEWAEDIIQHTFLAALEQWPAHPPQHKEAWLFKVCKNLAVAGLKKDRLIPGPGNPAFRDVPEEIPMNETDLTLGQLSVLFAFTDQRFSPRNQVILTLRYVSGLRIEQIAAGLGEKKETVIKAIQRCKTLIDEKEMPGLTVNNQKFLSPGPAQLESVTKTLYLLFNEGYKTTNGPTIISESLCETAIGHVQDLLRWLHGHQPNLQALYALMLFNVARFESRFDKDGNIIDLEHQDRGRWNKKIIAVASEALSQATWAPADSAYHLEAAIASLHARADSFAGTNWTGIAVVYDRLYRLNPSPFVLLNRAAALMYGGNYVQSQSILDELASHSYLRHHYLFLITQGKLYQHTGRIVEANGYFAEGLAATRSVKEQRYISSLFTETTYLN